MDYKDVLKSARENLNGSCKVCKVCNGIACSGEVPGMGGKGTGSAFTENMKSLEKVKINMRVLHDVKNPNTSVEMFGKKMKAPIFAAPVSGTTLNMGGKYTEKEYISWVIEGCLKAGIYPMVGDTAIETFLTDNLEVLKEKNADGIAFIKPWENDAIISKMKLAEDAGVFALGVDVDACGLVTLSLHGKNVEPKTLDKIKELKQLAKDISVSFNDLLKIDLDNRTTDDIFNIIFEQLEDKITIIFPQLTVEDIENAYISEVEELLVAFIEVNFIGAKKVISQVMKLA